MNHVRRKTIRRILRHPMFTIGLVIFLSVILVAIFADTIAPRAYEEMNMSDSFQPPSAEYPFGTDNYGRCLFSRIIYGSRIALRVGLIVVSIQALLGISFGLLAGYYGGNLDRIISFLADVTWSMPPLVFAMAIVMALGPSLDNVIIAIALVSWAQMARVVRSKTQSVKSAAYVEAARAIGRTDSGIMARHILPNIMSPIIVLVTLALPMAILSTTSLSFLGLGAQPPTPDWGVILNEGVDFIQRAPWISVFPGLALVYTVLGFNLLGVGLRDILDPQLKDL
ncbi:MAG: ABC transporter permease [Clostridia bacterium]